MRGFRASRAAINFKTSNWGGNNKQQFQLRIVKGGAQGHHENGQPKIELPEWLRMKAPETQNIIAPTQKKAPSLRLVEKAEKAAPARASVKKTATAKKQKTTVATRAKSDAKPRNAKRKHKAA